VGTNQGTSQESRVGRGLFAGYDDFADMLVCRGAHLNLAVCADLVDRLAVYDVTHLGGGSADAGRPSPYQNVAAVAAPRLLRDLARAPEPRLRDALIALLLRHPEHATTVRAVLSALAPDDSTRASLTARLLAAAALQRIHRAALAQDLPGYALIDVADLVAAYDLPSPEDEGGQALLRAAKEALAGRHGWLDYVDGWEDVAQHALRELHWAVARPQPLAVE